MKLIALAIAVALSVSGCTSISYSSSQISEELNNSAQLNSYGSGLIESEFGSHEVEVTVSEYKIQEISHTHNMLVVQATGAISVMGSPHDSTPVFTATIKGNTEWTDDGRLILNILSASDVTLTEVSKLHLIGIREHVKGIVAMTLIEKNSVILDAITKEEGSNVRIRIR